MTVTLATARLRLRPWHDEDLQPFAALNADPRVMAHYPKPLSRAESDDVAARIRAGFAERSFGLWAVEVPDVVGFIGYVGLSVPTFRAPFTPCVEVGWRLALQHWGHGYATEAARAAVAHAFGPLGLDEVVSFTMHANRRSRAVMKRLGMRRAAEDDFDHPSFPEGHLLRRHVLCRLLRADYSDRRSGPRGAECPGPAGPRDYTRPG